MPDPEPTVALLDSAAHLAPALAAAGMHVLREPALQESTPFDALLLGAPSAAALHDLARRREYAPWATERAVVVVARATDEGAEAALLRGGVEAIVDDGAGSAALVRAVHHAIERKRAEREARLDYATDLTTGLPHEAQLLEHMTQLLALRDREPVPMGLIVLRLDGYARAAARLGPVASNLLRRKVAVRLRGRLRASDVVASLGQDGYAVLLGRLESCDDGERVTAKLARSLQQPIAVEGQHCSIGASIGLAVYPDHGRDAGTLFRRAAAQAGWVATSGRGATAMRREGGSTVAANDESP